MKHRRKNIRWNTMGILAAGFLGVILLGGVLLWLPVCNQQPITFMDALFTSTTSVCVTGLVTIVPATQFTLAGKIVLLLLIQIGGLGIIGCATFFFLILRKKITVRERVLLHETYNSDSLGGIVGLVRKVILGTFVVEGAGAVLYAFQFVPEYGVIKGIGYAVFHAVSAFCNAGIDILGENSFAGYVDNPVINITTMLLIILSGIGFTVWYDVIENGKRIYRKEVPKYWWFTRLRLHSKIAIVTTLFLLVSGTLCFFFMEYRNPDTIGNMSFGDKMMASMFQSVTTRTAGFASISQSGLTNGSKLLACMLMIIGGSPAGTAGGIKTTTVAVLLLTAISVLRGNKDTECYGRKITFEIIRVGMTITLVTFVFWLFGVTVMTVIEPQQKVLDLMFEATSAMATVGLTEDLTPVLSDISHVVLMLMMYIGRIGPMTMALIFSGHADKKNQFRTLPEAKIMVG